MTSSDAESGLIESDSKPRRRPSGEPPLLPRDGGWARWLWLFVAVVALGLVLRWAIDPQDAESPFLRTLQDHRTSGLTDLAKAVAALAGPVAVQLLRWGTVVVLALYKRWRHLVVFLATFVVADWIMLQLAVQRPPPAGVHVLSSVAPDMFPSAPVTALAVTVFGMGWSLVPLGRGRRWAFIAAVVVCSLVALARMYLGADYPIDAAYAVLLGFSASGLVFRAIVPDEAFPVSYARGGTAAHLDLGGERGAAIVRAMADQLGLTVTEVKPFGLEGSGGSSPLRMKVEELDGHLFGKVFATSHVRADRWYKIGRTILYGRLEDEVPFGSVRRLTEYEDYALRLLDDAGVRVARTYGVVELAPNREYMLVTEFFEGANNLGNSEIDDEVIDEGLALIRTFWNSGVAHRDVKPANLLVRDGHLQLVDVSGLEVRPTPWRQAVDLANMMLTLALRSDADRVWQRALLVFTPEEMAEGFAAVQGMAIPTELQTKLKADPRPLLERFRELAPPHAPISIQRWSLQRLGTIGAAVIGLLVLVAMFVDSIQAGLY
jgi:membrane-associated phospholipid phosphatase/tRNA A-37 threonylcarbamoyl transferase component Bud32